MKATIPLFRKLSQSSQSFVIDKLNVHSQLKYHQSDDFSPGCCKEQRLYPTINNALGLDQMYKKLLLTQKKNSKQCVFKFNEKYDSVTKNTSPKYNYLKQLAKHTPNKSKHCYFRTRCTNVQGLISPTLYQLIPHQNIYALFCRKELCL